MALRVERGAEPIPGYTLIERLGGGGFGEVWKAEAPGGLLKAIKIVHGDLEQAAGGEEGHRAEQELKALRRVKTVRHPYILSLERFDIIAGRLLIVMELADRNLWDRFKECRSQGLTGMPRDELLRYMEETAEALDLMNSQYQLQHLDIKPHNLFLVHNHVKVADFGLVKDLRGIAASVTGGVTPVYAAPETFDGVVSRYCDQYSLAIVYQELLTGQRPYVATNVHQVVMQHVRGTPNLAPLPETDRAAIARALAKSPDERYPSCTELVRALYAADPFAPGGGRRSFHDAPAPFHEPPPDAGRAVTPPPDDGTCTAVIGQLEVRPAAVPVSEPSTTGLRSEPVPPATPEVAGPGELVPAVVIGVGGLGQQAVRQLGAHLIERFGSLGAVPHLRLFGIDTDPEAATLSANPDGAADVPVDVLVARLNRARHYLGGRKGGPRLEGWFDTAMLYRIQRDQRTGGVRALGRLALLGNHAKIVQRLRADLDACRRPEALATAAAGTGLAPRSNHPRVYVVTSLGGGSGSGMFLDVAYLARHALRQLGYADPAVHGLFFLPPADAAADRAMALGNTFAALTELNHFSSPAVTFVARYDERQPPVKDPAGPFTRCVFLPESGPGDEAARLGGQLLGHELTTQLGRIADTARVTRSVAARPAGAGLAGQTVGLYRLAWPRRALLRRAAHRYCRRLVRRWMAKDATPVRAAVQGLVQEQWDRAELGAEALIARFQEACARALGRDPEDAFRAVIDPLAAKPPPELDPAELRAALQQLVDLVGKPSESSLLHKPAAFEEALQAAQETVVADCQGKLIPFTSGLAERPEFRLAGAEEASRQLIARIEETLKTHEPLCQELAARADRAHERLEFLITTWPGIVQGGRKSAPLVAELGELLRAYPKWRYQAQVLRRVVHTYTSLRGYLSDQVREIGFWRLRLAELLQAYEHAGDEPAAEAAGCGFLFPEGCSDLAEAADRLLPEPTPTDLEAFDRPVQELLAKEFTGLRHVCVTSSTLLRRLQAAMLAEAEDFLGARLAATDVVEAFLTRYPDTHAGLEALAGAFDRAAPPLAGAGAVPQAEIAFVAFPPSPQAPRLRELVRHVAPQAEVVVTPSVADLVCYREETQVELADLPQLGPAAAEAYEQMMAAEHFTPHTRTDIADWTILVREPSALLPRGGRR